MLNGRTIKVNLSLEVSVMEDLHRNLFLAVVKLLELGVFDSDVLLDVLSRKLNLFVFTTTNATHNHPVCKSGRESGEKQDENVCLETTAVDERKKPFHKPRDDKNKGSKVIITELVIALSNERLGLIHLVTWH